MIIERIREQLFFLKIFLNKRFFAVLGIYILFIISFSLLIGFLFSHTPFLKEMEVSVQHVILSFRSESLTVFLKIVTNLGGEIAMIFFVAVVFLFFFIKRSYLYAIGIVFSVGIAEFVSLVLKPIVGRVRPPALIALAVEHSPSFPSGHTIAAVAFYGFLAYVFYRAIQHKILRIILLCLCGIMTLLTGFTRVYLGVHWPGDVFASYIFGGMWVILVIYFIEKQKYLPHSV